jgi:methyl-accepting chemotaxis protein
MRSKGVINQMIIKTALILCVCGMATILFSSYLVRNKLETYQSEEIEQVTKVVAFGVESTGRSTETIENQMEKKLLTASKEIAKALREKTMEGISAEDLLELTRQWDLYGISLFVRQGDDIVVAQSSEEQEVGLSSKDWGYWFTAFDQLMSGEKVTVEKGYGTEHYWVGPISRSEWENKYYKYAYYYDGTTPFMINPYILDEDIYSLTFHSGTTQMIEKIVNENRDIEEIAVMNAPAWLKGSQNILIEPLIDRPVLYGTHHYELAEDEARIHEVLESGLPAAVTFQSEGKKMRKFYRPLPDNRIMTVVVNMKRQEEFNKLFTVTLSAAFFIVFLTIFYVFRAIAKRQLLPLKKITEHIHSVADGNLARTLHIKDKNEWGWLSEQINEMTQRMSGLIHVIKDDMDSMFILSSRLSKRVHSSLETMNEVSVSMTYESKTSLTDLHANIEMLQNLLQSLIEGDALRSADAGTRKRLETNIDDINEHLHHLIGFLETHTSHVTTISIMFYNTLRELTEAIKSMDRLSHTLKRKIEVFHFREENK